MQRLQHGVTVVFFIMLSANGASRLRSDPRVVDGFETPNIHTLLNPTYVLILPLPPSSHYPSLLSPSS